MTTTVNLSTIKHVWKDGRYDKVPLHGTIRLDINVEEIIKLLGHKALVNKTGKARMLSGMVKATRL